MNLIFRKLLHIRLQPIRIFCFHQVSDEFDPSTMWECDWTQIDVFKQKILRIKKQYTFISLPEATEKLKHDTFRRKKYAVLTADDGWDSLKNILPWLAEQQIPITLFVNPCYLDGVHKQERATEKLLTQADLMSLSNKYAGITIGSHGWTHVDTSKMDKKEFLMNIHNAETVLCQYDNKIPFYAFTYGRYKSEFFNVLTKNNLIPVLMDGQLNYSFNGVIHRECIDGDKLCI